MCNVEECFHNVREKKFSCNNGFLVHGNIVIVCKTVPHRYLEFPAKHYGLSDKYDPFNRYLLCNYVQTDWPPGHISNTATMIYDAGFYFYFHVGYDVREKKFIRIWNLFPERIKVW